MSFPFLLSLLPLRPPGDELICFISRRTLFLIINNCNSGGEEDSLPRQLVRDYAETLVRQSEEEKEEEI